MHERRGFTPLEIKISNGVSKRFPTGFTLIELLVVIAIIAVLMSILVPTLYMAKEQKDGGNFKLAWPREKSDMP